MFDVDFKAHEPTGIYPVFADCDNRFGYVLRETYIPTPKAAVRHALGRLIRRDHHTDPAFLARIVLDSVRGLRVGFRGAFLDRHGRVLAQFSDIAMVRHLEAFDISVTDLLAQARVPLQDGQFLLIADRGVKLDGGYGTGTVGATYINERTFTCYRNSAFARPFNDLRHHRPRGFRSIVPFIRVTEDVDSSIYFFNFSTDRSYEMTANPVARLWRNAHEYLEGEIGPIAPFGAIDRSMTSIFGDEVRDFLAQNDGYGTLICEQPGITLGSIHICRNRRTGGMSIEHTRPVHNYVA